jgi:hypothetical protein
VPTLRVGPHSGVSITLNGFGSSRGVHVAGFSRGSKSVALVVSAVFDSAGTLPVTLLPEKLDGQPVWFFEGYTRFEGVVVGGASHGISIATVLVDEETGREGTAHLSHSQVGLPYPITGGSDSGVPAVRSTEMAPIPPNAQGTPAKPWRPSMTRYFFEIIQRSSARCGRPERSNVSMASSGDPTSGSPCRLNDVFSTAPMPVRRSNSRITRW